MKSVSTSLSQTQRGPPLGRHIAAVGLTAVLTLVLSRGSLPLSHAVLADTSFILLGLILMLGAVARLVPRLRPVVPWGRELGIGMFVTASLHVALLIEPDENVIGFFDNVIFPEKSESPSMWTGANWVGALALGYALVLAATSNDWSQRKLGRGWKFLQRQAYTLFVLTWLHTAAFVLLGAGHGASLSGRLFWGVTTAAVVAQFAGFVHTVRRPRGPSPHRVPPKIGADGSGALSMRAVRWFGVVVLWGVVILGSWVLAHVQSAEEKQQALLCERYAELGPLPRDKIQEELSEFIPADEPPNTLWEWIENCDEE